MSNEVSFRLGDPAKPLILVPTSINGKGPYDFALDTGASMTILSGELVQSLGVSRGVSRTGVGAGGSVEVSLASVDSLAIGRVEVKRLQVAVMDLDILSQAVGVRLMGIIGYNFLRSFRVTIDYPKKLLRLD
jgi:predicted aspartyl protease